MELYLHSPVWLHGMQNDYLMFTWVYEKLYLPILNLPISGSQPVGKVGKGSPYNRP